jgi:hypothetical protein
MLDINAKNAPKRALATLTGRGRKSTFERALETVGSSLDAIGDAAPNLPDVASGKARRAALIAAGGMAGLTAGSAAISSLRRRTNGSGDGS